MEMRSIKKEKPNYELPMNEGMLPHLSLSLKALPEAKDWKIGEKYNLALQVRQKMINENDVHFEIVKIGVEESDAMEDKPEKKTKRYSE